MKAFVLALSAAALAVLTGCASQYVRVVDTGGSWPPAQKIQLPAKPDVECSGEWVWNMTSSKWACVSSVPVRAPLTPMQQWLLNPYGSPYGGYTSGYIRGCTRSVCFGSSWVR